MVDHDDSSSQSDPHWQCRSWPELRAGGAASSRFALLGFATALTAAACRGAGRPTEQGACAAARERHTTGRGRSEGRGKAGRERPRSAEDSSRLVYPDECGPGAGPGDGDRPHEPAGDGPGEGRLSGLREQQGAEDSHLCREDAPVSIGIIFDLSGSMTSKLIRARESILQFIKTANPQDEFFVIGFNDRPELIEDFTNSVEDIQARLATVRSGHRTALLDAIYYGVAKMKDARHERKALLVVSDGGDNRSRYTEGEVRSQVREADVEIYSIGIFDPYAPTPEERTGPQLLEDISEVTGGRLFRVDDIDEMGDIAEKISTELRNQYVIGYRPEDLTRDGKWRKVKVKVNPPPGLPPLTVYARTGYYAPLQ